MAVQLTGIGVSRGIVIGKAHTLLRGELEVLEYSIPKHLLGDEVARFRRALEIARGQLRAIRERVPPNTRADIVEFIDTHILMLEDSTLTIAPEHLIHSLQCNAEWALKLQRDALPTVARDPDAILEKAERLVEELNGHGSGVLILTDIYGSTPSNIINRLQGRYPVQIVAGINVPMLVRVLNYPRLSLDELAAKALSGGRDGIVLCKPVTGL